MARFESGINWIYMVKTAKYLSEAIRFHYPLVIKYRWLSEVDEEGMNATITEGPGRIMLSSGLPKQKSFYSDTSLLEVSQHELESVSTGGNRWVKIRNLLFVVAQIYIIPPDGPVLRLKHLSGLNSLKINATQWAEIRNQLNQKKKINHG